MSEVIRAEGSVTVIPDGDIVADKVGALREELSLIVEDSSTLVLDLRSVTMIDSSGIGVLISTQNKLKSKGGEMRIINTATDIYKMFVIMRLDKHFEISEMK